MPSSWSLYLYVGITATLKKRSCGCKRPVFSLKKASFISHHSSPHTMSGTADKGKFILCLFIGSLLVLGGLGLQAWKSDRSTLDNDFDEEFSSKGMVKEIDDRYILEYDESYTGQGNSNLQPVDSYSTTKDTTITAVSETNKFVTYTYRTEIVEQPKFMIDTNKRDEAAGLMMNPMDPGTPYVFYPHYIPPARLMDNDPDNDNISESVMVLDKYDRSYYTPMYEGKGIIVKTGYARSVLTNDLDKDKSYPVWIGAIKDTVDAGFKEEEKVGDVDGYRYEYSYSFARNLSEGNQFAPRVVLVFTETTSEVHEPFTGALMKIDTTMIYTLESYPPGAPQEDPAVVTLYREESHWEMSSDDSDSLATGLSWIGLASSGSYVLSALGLVLMMVGVLVFRKD